MQPIQLRIFARRAPTLAPTCHLTTGEIVASCSAMKRIACVVAFCLLCDLHALCLKNRERTFTDSCDKVWPVVVAVSKTEDYRIISISKEEQVVSLAVGGVWSGERLVTLSLSPGIEGGCKASVQSRFSGLAHSDGPDLLSRVEAKLMAIKLDLDDKAVGKAFQRYKDCLTSPMSDSKCEAKLRKTLDALRQQQSPHQDADDWWRKDKK